MPYGDFTIKQIKEKFGIDIEERSDAFTIVAPLAATALLSQTLAENVPLATAISSQKARSEFIVAPVLMEVRRQCDRQMSIFSGIDLNVDPSQGLKGTCDFLLCRSPSQLEVEAPLIAIIEAKPEDLAVGVPQCLAAMLAARLFNRAEKRELPAVFGVVTSGTNWRFLRLREQHALADMTEYPIHDVNLIVGILVAMMKGQIPADL